MPSGIDSHDLTYDVSLADVDHEQAGQNFLLSFSAKLEKIFKLELIEEDLRNNKVALIFGVGLFNLFLVSDYIILETGFSASVLLHLLFYTPMFVILRSLLTRRSRHHDILTFFSNCLPLFTEMMILCLSTGFNRLYYMSGMAAAPMCIYVLLRPTLRWAILAVVLQCVAFLLVVMLTDIVGTGGRLVTALFCISGGVVTVVTAYAWEGACRRSFLLRLRVGILNRELGKMAMTDPLMGLGNRRLLEENTASFWGQPSHAARLASLILIDVDHFKSFNDNYGHSAGDMCLKTIARCVAGLMRNSSDIAVRFGGEEIAVFLPDTDLTQALALAEQIRVAIVEAAIPHPALAKNAVVSASFGVATGLIIECTPAELAIKADMALYAAKHHGRNQVWPPVDQVSDGRPSADTPAMPAADLSCSELRKAS